MMTVSSSKGSTKQMNSPINSHLLTLSINITIILSTLTFLSLSNIKLLSNILLAKSSCSIGDNSPFHLVINLMWFLHKYLLIYKIHYFSHKYLESLLKRRTSRIIRNSSNSRVLMSTISNWLESIKIIVIANHSQSLLFNNY